MAAIAHPALGVHLGIVNGFMHPFTGTDHILAMVAVGRFAANLRGRVFGVVPMTFMGVMAVRGTLWMTGMIPYAEMMIALSSAALLGLAVAIPRHWSAVAAMNIVGLFALFHGHPHGTEMAGAFSTIEYGSASSLLTVCSISPASASDRPSSSTFRCYARPDWRDLPPR